MRFVGRLPRRRDAAALALACALAGCAGAPPPAPAVVDLAQAERIVAAPDRTQADRIADRRRRPAALLAFIGLRPGLAAFDVEAGDGYTTELLARAIGPAGRVYGQGQPRDGAHPMPRPPAGADGGGPQAPRTPAEALAARARRLQAAGVAAAPIAVVATRDDDPIPPPLTPGRLDLVTLVCGYHDLVRRGVDRRAMNAAIFQALAPGGTYVIAECTDGPAADAPAPGGPPRIEASFVRAEVEAAGFRLAAQATFPRRPAPADDPGEGDAPSPPEDAFLLKFVKPR